MNDVFGQTPFVSWVAIFVPSTMHDRPLEPQVQKAVVRSVTTEFAKSFGGYFCIPGFGGWYSEALDTVIEEETTVVLAFIPNGNLDYGQAVTRIALALKEELDQEVVFILIDGIPYLI